MVEIPDSLVERLKRRQTALVSGLGIGELAGSPGWAALVEWLASRVSNEDDRAAALKLVGSGRIADAVSLVRAALGPGALPAAIREAYPDGSPVPDTVGLAATLPWRAVVTTGFDDLWERALTADSEKESRRPPHVLLGTDTNAGAMRNGHGAPLMHLFGRTVVPESLCLGPADAHERLTPAGGLAWLEDLRRRRSLVLVGFRATDPDLDWLTSWMSVVPSTDVPHFLFLDVSRDADPVGEARLVALRTGMTVIPCPGGTAEAVDLLAELSTDIGAKMAPFDADIDIEDWLGLWAMEPNNPEPREVLARAASALRFEQEWERLIELLLGRFELQDDRAEQLASLREAAEVFRGPLSASDRALTTGLAALRLAPTDDALWENLKTDAAAAGAWEELFNDGCEVAKAMGQTPEAARVWREIARVAWHQLDRAEAAVAPYQEAVRAEPSHAETRDELGELLRRLERWADLVPLLQLGAAETRDLIRASRLLIEAAEILETQLTDPAGAIGAFEAVLAHDPESLRAWAELDRLYESQGRWADLATLLDSRARRSPQTEGAALRRRRAEMLFDRLQEGETAALDLEALLAADPNDRASLNLLDRIYDKTEHVDDHLRILQRLVDIAPDDAQRLPLLRRLAALWEPRPNGLDRAADALEHILRIDPRDPEAFSALRRVYREVKRPSALADVLARQVELTEAEETRIELNLALGQTYDQELDDPEKAFAAYSAAERLGDRTEETYEALVRLAERLARWPLCAEALQKWADVATDAEVKAEVLLQASLLLNDQLQDRAGAQALLARVLEIAPEHAGAMTSLARLCRDNGEHERAVTLFLEAQQRLPGLEEKAELLTEAATICQDKLQQEDRALELYGRALSVNSDYLPAGERLADIAFGRGQWTEVEPILDMLVRKLNQADAARMAAVQHRLARVALELGKADKALDCFAEAHRLAPEALPVLRDFAEFRDKRGEWKEARDLYDAIRRLHRMVLSGAENLSVTMNLGRCAAQMGDAVAAIDWYEKAQAQDPMYRPAIEALAALHEEKADWIALVRDKRALKTIAMPEEQAPLMEEIGDLYFERLGEAIQSEAAYRAALDAEPTRRSTLHKLLALYTKEKDWRQAAETLVRLAEIESDPSVKAKSLFAAALIRRDELKHHTEAADLLERALDESPQMTQAFDVLENLHRDQSDWPELARSYRRMIRRLPPEGHTELRLRLWSQMGELALKRLRNRDVAVAAFEVAASLDPSDFRYQETLADLYVQAGPAGRDKAIAAHQHLIARNPNRLASYRALAKLYGDTREFDKHWCVCATLSFLGKADAGLEAMYQRHRPPQLRLARRRFNEEVWQRVLHPDEDRLLDALFVLVGAHLAAPAARTHVAVGLRRKKRADFATDTRVPVRALARVCETMDLAVPELYVLETEGSETAVVNLQEKGSLIPTMVLGSSTLRRRDDFELVFDLSKRMAFLRPERFMRVALGTPAALDVGLRVALSLAGSPIGPGAQPAEVARLTDYLRKTVAPQTIEQLALVGPKFVAARGETVDFEKWLVATDLSAARAALLVTGDLWAAARVISSEPPTQSSLPVKERLKDLIAFSVSEEYFICRRLLGLEIA